MNIKTNFLYNIIYQVFIMITPLLTAPYISRVLGEEMLGTFSYTYSVACYFALFAVLGVNNYGNREIARARDSKEKVSKTFWGIFLMQFFLGIIVCIAYSVWAFKVYDGNKLLAFVQLGYVIAESFNINWFFFGLEKFKLTVTRNVVIKICSVVMIFCCVKKKEDIIIYALIMMLATLVGQIVLWVYLKKEIIWSCPKLYEIIKHIKPNLTLFIPVIAVSIYKVMDKIMLGNMSTMSEVAYYEYGEKVTTIAVSVITALGTVMMPRISKLMSEGNDKKILRYIENSMKISIMMSSAMAFGIAAVGELFAIWFYGESFATSGTVMAGLSITIIFISCANVIRTQYLIPGGKDRIYIISVIGGAVTNALINYLLIPEYKAMGAVIGTVCAEFVVMIYQMVKVNNDLPILKYVKDGIPFIEIGLFMFICIEFINNLIDQTIFVKLLIEVVLGAVIYISISMIYIKRNSRELYGMIVSLIPKHIRWGK